MRRLLAALLATGLLAACAPGAERGSGSAAPPGDPRVEVDSPELRKLKARIGMQDCVPGSASPVEGGLPEMTLACLGGGPDVHLAALRGPMVINLWQSYCAPCKEEMPALQSFHQQYGDRVAVLGIDIQDVRPGAALDLAGETGATYPSLADPGGELLGDDAFAIARRGVPAFVFLREDGTVGGVASGGVDSTGEVVDLVEEHLGVQL